MGRFRRRGGLAVALVFSVLVAGCAAPEDDPPAPVIPAKVETPAPTTTPTPVTPPRLPPLEDLVISPAGIGSLLIGQPVFGTDMIVYDPEFCGPWEGEEVGYYQDGTPVEYGRWRANYPAESESPLDAPFSTHVDDGKAQVIEILAPTLATAEGIRVGSSLTELKAAYPSITPGAEGSMSATLLLSTPTGAMVFEVLNANVYSEYAADTVFRIQITEVGNHDLHPHFATDALIGGCM